MLKSLLTSRSASMPSFPLPVLQHVDHFPLSLLKSSPIDSATNKI